MLIRVMRGVGDSGVAGFSVKILDLLTARELEHSMWNARRGEAVTP
jgi:hypothetical protein